MPKSIKEISSFNLGTLFNVSEKDTPIEASAFSLNVNPIAEDGILDSINSHKLAVSIDKLNEVSFAYPIKWGDDGTMIGGAYNNSSGQVWNKSSVVLENIQSLDNQTQCTLRVEGIKGRRELLRMTNIEPWLERTMATSTLPVEYKPTAAFNIEDDYIDFLSNTNAITGTVTNVAFDGFTENEATIEVNSTAPGDLDTDEFVVTTPDGTIKTYIFKNSSGTSGTLDVAKPQIFVGSLSTEATIAAEVKAAIEHADGHNGKISVVQTDGQLEGCTDLSPTPSAAWAANADYEGVKAWYTSAGGTGCVVDITTDGSGNPEATIVEKGSGYTLSSALIIEEPKTGDDLIVNGSMELNSNWSASSGSSVAQTTDQAYEGTNSFKFTAAGSNDGIRSAADFTTVTGKRYMYSFWIYPPVSTATLVIRRGDDGADIVTINITALIPNTWNYYSSAYTETNGGSNAYFEINSGSETSGTWYVDSISLRQQEIMTLDVNDISSKLTLTDEHKALTNYFEEGDYISFTASGATDLNSQTAEFLQIKDIDESIYRMYFERRCFGSQSIFPLSASTSYGIFSNKLTTNGVQVRTTRGIAHLNDWSKYAGNHIGGNGRYYYKVTSAANHQRYAGVINASSYNIVFSNANKTITFTGAESLYSFSEQDTITLWGSTNDVINSGKSFKILKIDGVVAHVDIAPTDGTINSGIVYIETNLLKNHTFHHAVGTNDEGTSTIGADKSKKINQWEHYQTGQSNIYELDTTSKVVHVASGGYWEDTTAGHADLAENYYPCDENDKYISIESEFGGSALQIQNTTSISEEDTHIFCDEEVDEKLSKNDIILIDNEYMKVTAIDGINLYVERAVMGATGSGELNAAATHNFGAVIKNCFNHSIRQKVPNSRLYKKQAYNLTFFAKSLDYNGELIDEENNRTFEESAGVDWLPYGSGAPSISIDSSVSNKLEVTTDTTNTTQGARLTYANIDNASLNPLTVGKVYQLNIDLKQITSLSTFSGDYTISLAGVSTVIGPLTNEEQTYTVTVTCTNAIGALIIYNSSATATIFTIDNVSVKEVVYPEGSLSIQFGPGYFEKDGAWRQNSQDITRGITNNTSGSGMVQQEDRWIDFQELNMPDGDNPSDNNSLDNTWRKFSLVFYMPKEVEFTQSNAELVIDFASRGTNGSKIGVDFVDLREHPLALIKKQDSIAPSSSGFINNSGIKDLVIYDTNDSDITIVPGFKLNQTGILRPTQALTKSLYASERTLSNTGEVTYAPNNRETHIGFGSGAEDSPPQWLGYVNSKVFDEDSTNELYQDEDTIHSYDAGSTTSLSKVCVAGEHECLAATWTDGTKILEVEHPSHLMNLGDNIVIREWEDVSNTWSGRGVWVVTAADPDGDGNSFECKRYTSLDLNPTDEDFLQSTGNRDGNTGLVCYRPYYYYGIKEGDSAIYRISPDTLIDENSGTPALDTSGDYDRGTIERSVETTKPIGSIATCYNKKADGTGGGMIYILSSDSKDYKDTEITAINVEVAYNKWTSDKLDEVCTFVPRFRAFKWSNDSTNGNINTGSPESTSSGSGTVRVFNSIASTSTPSIKAAGIPSDIIETKGPNHTYDSKATTNTTNNPSMFDTRLWLQFRPGGNESFSEGDRFLFASRSIAWHFEGGDRHMYFADRTPPTTTVFGKEVRYAKGSHKFRAGPGVSPTDGDPDNVHKKLSDKELKKYAYFWHALGSKGNSRDYLKKISPIRDGSGKYWDNTIINANYGKHPYFHFGYNVGWDGHGGNFPAIKVPKYGLVPMLDNDHDGIIDGTGLVVPSLKTLPDQVNGIRMGPYGNYHQRVCAHAVGLVAKSNRPWVRHWGKLHDFADASHFVSGQRRDDKWPHQMDAPENMTADKMLMISSDVHYGDFQPRWDYEVTSLTSSNNSSIDAYTKCVRVKTKYYGSSNDIGRTMQAGDMIYLEGGNYNQACSIVRVISSREVVLSLKFLTGSDTYKLYPFTQRPWHYSRYGIPFQYTGIPSGSEYKSFHWAFDDKKPKSGGRFYKKKQAAGHFVKNWWTAPTSYGFHSGSPAGSEMQAPGLLNRIEKLNYKAGCLIRPFDKNTNTFSGLSCGNGTVVSIASAPDAVYHQKNSTKLHYNVGTTNQAGSDNIKHNSKLHIADDRPGTKYSRLWLADTSFMLPDKKHSREIKMTTGTKKTHGFNKYPLDRPLLAGEIHSYHTTITGDRPNGENCPVIRFKHSEVTTYAKRKGGDVTSDTTAGQYRNKGVWVGACISIRDKDTGIIQTRQIVESRSTGTYTYVHVHYPFAHKPDDGDNFWLWKHAYVCTAPLRLFTDKNVGYGLGRAYHQQVAGEYQLRTPFRHSLAIKETRADGTYTTIVTNSIHHFSNGDKIKLKNIDSPSISDGIYDVYSATNPRLVLIANGGSGADTAQTGATIERYTWDSPNTHNNHIRLEIDKPLLHTMFGGLDLRKTFTNTTTNFAESSGKNTITTGEDNNYRVGDAVQIDTTSDEGKDGVFSVIERVNATNFKVWSTDTSGAGAGISRNVWWQSLIASQTGTAKLGEISHGLYSWSKGREDGNIVREDREDKEDSDIYMTTAQTVIDIQASSSANSAGYFKANNIYRYKISLIYDGYQEGLLSSGTWEYIDTSGRDSLDITLQIKEYSKRLTHICIYRKDTKNALYKLVKEVRTDTGWEYDDEKWSFEFEDEGDLGASYEARTGLSEILDTIKVKYGMSIEIDGYLFAGNCGHDKIENAENLIFRSKPGRFSTFDYVNDFIQLKSKPTAMANFLGRLFVFDFNNIYKINQETLAIEDIFEGIGCVGKDSITVTEHGMFFADRNGAYIHNGNVPQKLSDSISKSGDTDTNFGGTDNIKDISWSNTGGNELARYPYVIYDSVIESVLFFVEYLDKAVGVKKELKYLKSNYIWSYNIRRKRWDLWELDKDSELGVPFAGNKGQILVPVDNGIYEIRGSDKKMDYTWMSKKIKLEGDSILKVYNKLKINGIEDNVNLGGTNKESSDRLLVHTNAGAVSSSDVTYRSKDSGNSTYKLSGSKRKGRWMQFKLEDMTEPIDSIGIIYRLRAVK